MALVLADRVQETTTTAGTGTITLAGAVTGYQSFSTAIGNGNTTYYTIAGGSEWEVGIGTYASAGNTLSRDTVLASSAGGTTKVTFSAGTKDVFVTYPAEKAISNGYGTLPVSNGGTGQSSYTDGQLLIGNTTGNTLAKGTLTAGSGILVTNGAGAITLAATTNLAEFSSSGTWTKPSGVTFVMVECWGAGGGGAYGGGSGIYGSGGGGGAYAFRLFKASDLGATETVTIGLGGTGGSSTNGSAGGNTSFGTKLYAYGGGGGTRGGIGGIGGGVLTAGGASASAPLASASGDGHFGSGSSADYMASGFGGGRGGGGTGAGFPAGGCSYQGGAGGGSGGYSGTASGDGGSHVGRSGGGAAGATGTSGAAGTTATGLGIGGGGGAYNSAGNGGKGGDGGPGGGGGGGGGGGSILHGNGGAGGNGYCRVYSW